MKKTATILVLIFVLVQAVPAVCSLFSLQTGLFLVNEEKVPELTENKELKEVKNIQWVTGSHKGFTQKVHTAILLAETILLSPCLEKHTPPPDFI